MPTTSLPENVAATIEQEKLEMLRHAVAVGIRDLKQGRVDGRPIDEILEEIDRESA